jgi:hypothetical protein
VRVEKNVVLYRQTTNIATLCPLAKKGGENTYYEIYRYDRARRDGSEPWRLRQQVHHDSVYDVHDRFARLLEVTTAPRGLPFKQSQVGIRQPGFFA